MQGRPLSRPTDSGDPIATLLGRLEGLLDAYWLTAVSGDVKAAELVRRLLQQQAEMYGMRGKAALPADDEGDDELAKLRARRAGA